MSLRLLLSVTLASALLTGCQVMSILPGAKPSEDKLKALETYTRLGLEYLQAGDSVNAKIAVQKALEIDSNYPEAYDALGLIFRFESEQQLAEKYFKKALSLSPGEARFHNNYGAFLFSERRYQEACEQLKKATEDPFYSRRAQALDNLGRCYRQIERPKDALQAFEKSVNIGGRSSYALLDLAKGFLAEGDLYKANGVYQEFIQQVDRGRVKHTAESLKVGMDLAFKQRDSKSYGAYSLLMENLFPDEYQQYRSQASDQ